MAMKRTTEGLIQRRTVNSANSSASASNSTRNPTEDEAAESSGLMGNDVDVDSKDARLTLMEEVLLLGLKDKEVCYRCCCRLLSCYSVYVCDSM